LDPGNASVQKFIVSVVTELVKQYPDYPIDGLHIDGLRYPGAGARFGYNKGALERYRQETGATGRPDPMDPMWLDWRRRQLTGLLAQITRAVKEIRPEAIVSVSAMADGSAPKNAEGFRFSTPFAQALQDWMLWAAQGLADWICIMDFFDEQTEGALFNDWIDFAVANRGQAKVWIGVAGFRNWSIDAYNQIARARGRHVDGVAVYNFRQPVRDIAAASDFFAAWRDATLLSDRRATETVQAAAMPASLRERLDRMIRAAETATTEGETSELAPGIAALPASRPGSASRAASAPTIPVAAASIAQGKTTETLPMEYASEVEGVPGRRAPFWIPGTRLSCAIRTDSRGIRSAR
ncbi:MAG: family 10 glycosylhydrolase, partial [Candidatus Sumerlaeota bacterium]|nr:family 10 glycosylhydrolase [Candidatus Sumerlaeota bacterium]